MPMTPVSILELTRRALFQMSASSVFIKDLPLSLEDCDPVVSLWPEWKRALQMLDGLTEEQYAARVEERALIELTERFIDTRAQSIAGVLFKLQLLFEFSHLECGGPTAYPFPQLRKIIRDIERLA